jgi:hypothetical protein
MQVKGVAINQRLVNNVGGQPVLVEFLAGCVIFLNPPLYHHFLNTVALIGSAILLSIVY